MAKAITRVCPVYLVSADSAPGVHQPSDLGCESIDWRRPSTSPSPFIIIT